jgi:hypothetical protein
MYSVVKSVIESRNYELSDMLTKIDTLWVQGSITEEERAELIDLARQNAEVQQSIDILSKLEELDKRVRANEEAIKTLTETEAAPEEGGENEQPTYPEYEAGKWYYRDDIVSFDGKNYKCVAPEGVVCTWSPAEYPAYWEVYVEDTPIEEDAPLTE